MSPAEPNHSTLLTMLRLLCLLVGLAATVNGACDSPFHQVGEGCYYFSIEYNVERTWAEAREFCQGMGTDVDLAVLDTLCDDYVNLVNYLLIADAFVTLQYMWVGATGSGETWTWVDGRSLSVSSPHWYHSEPSSTGCVCLNHYIVNTWDKIHLYDYPCSSSFNFICQKNDALH